MNVTKDDMLILSENNQSMMQCVCGSIEDHIAETVDMYHKRCSKWCEVCKNQEVTDKQEDLVPKQSTCKNCGKKKGFKFPDDSGVEDAERNLHEVYAKGKASLLQEEEEVEVLSDEESEIAESTQIPENNPEVKATLEKQIMTIEPRGDYDRAHYSNGTERKAENDSKHNNMVQQSGYAHIINGGNTPHKQEKKPIDTVINIRHNATIRTIEAKQKQSYGSRKTYDECKRILKCTPECLNKGSRRISDNRINAMLKQVSWNQGVVKRLKEDLKNPEMKKYTKKINEKIEEADIIIAEFTAVIRSGNQCTGKSEKPYPYIDNTYDPVSFEKLALELDVPWTENVLDTHELAKRVEQENAEAWRYNYVM